MRRLILCLVGLLPFWVLVCAQAQFSSFPPGTFNSRSALDAGGSAAFQGAGDIVSGAKAWWGFRCYNFAYAGNVAQIKSPSDSLTTTITCSSGGTLGTTGTALATTCAVSCTVDILYDQSGGANCTGACDLTQTTEANRPSLIVSCQNSRSCLQFIGSATTGLCNTIGLTQSDPFTWSFVAERTSVSGNGGHPFESSVGPAQVFFRGVANQIGANANIQTNAGANDNVIHAVQIPFDDAGTGSSLNIDGVQTIGSLGTNAMGAQMCISGNDAASSDTYRVMEVGVWGSAFSGTNITNMNTNQHSISGWNF